MASNPRVIKAYDAMRALGISDEDVKPVLKMLLKVYDRKWEIIEEDNYHTLIDAYFELKEDKQEEGKRKAPINHQEGARPNGDDQVSSTDNSRQVLSVVFSAEDSEVPTKTSKQEIVMPFQTSIGDMKATTSSPTMQNKLSEIEIISNLPCTATRDKKSCPEKTSSAGHCKDPIDNPSYPLIQGKNVLSDHYQKDLITPRTKKFKSHLGPVSSSFRGPCDDSNVNLRFKSLKALYRETQKKDDSPTCNNNTNTRKASIDIASSPSGEVKISLKYDVVKKSMEEKNVRPHFLDDITKGSENVKISLLDECGSEDLPKFNYIPHNIIYQSANVNISLARIADEGCCSDCSGNCLFLAFSCACSQETGGEFAYTAQGLLKEEFLTVCMSMKIEPQDHHFVYCQECPLEKSKNEKISEPCKGHLVRKFIKECWRKCGCDMQCGNRVVQQGLRCKLQVFLTREGKGWGLRTLEDLPKGCFVCEYVGEILTNTELYERTLHNSRNDKHTYPVTLDADWGSEGVLKDEEALCLDATYNGNVARFINHRCSDANLIDIPVEVETPDHHYYHLALFTNRKVKAYEELTWDYGIDFDDHDHPIKAFHCCCGSSFCRDKKLKGTRLSKTKKTPIKRHAH